MSPILALIGIGSAWTTLVVALVIGAVTAVAVCHLLLLLAGAAANRRKLVPPATAPKKHPRFVIVMPAHNEELVLAATLDYLRKQEYPQDRYEIVVIADNCKDRTAQIAREYGVTVLERTNLTERGKGYALAWGFSQLLARPNPADGYAIVDADTVVEKTFLARMAAYLEANPQGTRWALQGRYGVLNGQESWRAALMDAAFELFNHIKPLGADRLGFLVGLKGNGMMFSHETLASIPWQGHSVTEDIDYGLDLLRAGIAIRYVPTAVVRAQMPVTREQAASQRKRWEVGRFKLIRDKALPLVGEAFRRGRPVFVEAALAVAAPPLAELCLLIIAGGVSLGLAGATITLSGESTESLIMPARIVGALLAFSALGFFTYIFAGLRMAGAGKDAYLALLKAPGYALWKLALYLPGNRGVTEWVRTERRKMPPGGNVSNEPAATEATR
ncbi:MAG: glycosyltransferase family 2 protein [Capsulimonadales bacterium]|nr:glycosyltransferase family 2 protein [Capsulimonadales bacterium]